MTNIIVHLDQAQTREQRWKLLKNDMYVFFHDLLTQLNEEGLTALSHVEVFLSAERFANLLLRLPNIQEGIEDELHDLEEDAEGENDAMIISVLAAFLIGVQRDRLPESDWQFLATHIIDRWDGHPLLFSMLLAVASKEGARLMEDKTNLLMCEMNEIHLDGAKAFVSDFVDICMGLTAESIEKILLPLRALKDKYGNTFDEQINRLQEKLNEKTTTQTTTQVNVQPGAVNMQNVEHYH